MGQSKCQFYTIMVQLFKINVVEEIYLKKIIYSNKLDNKKKKKITSTKLKIKSC